MLKNLQSLEVAYSQKLSPLEQEWLIGNLETLRGISDVENSSTESGILFIEFDTDLISSMELMDYLFFCGISPGLPPPIPDEWHVPDAVSSITGVAYSR